MDATLTQLFNLLPVAWRPYVVLFLIVAYVVTKWRSVQKSAQLKQQPKGGFTPKRLGAVAIVVDFLF